MPQHKYLCAKNRRNPSHTDVKLGTISSPSKSSLTASRMTRLRQPSSPFFARHSFSTSVMRWSTWVLNLSRRASSPVFEPFCLLRAPATCAEPRVVSKQLHCTGDQTYHKTRVLQGWYRETGDEVLQARARVCDGRCMAWGLLSPESWTEDAEQHWTGHLVRPSGDVVGAFLGYHGRPLRPERNTGAHQLRAACCREVDRSKAP